MMNPSYGEDVQREAQTPARQEPLERLARTELCSRTSAASSRCDETPRPMAEAVSVRRQRHPIPGWARGKGDPSRASREPRPSTARAVERRRLEAGKARMQLARARALARPAERTVRQRAAMPRDLVHAHELGLARPARD